MADIMTGGVVKRETEFIETQPGNPASRIFATCGPDALASVASAALNQWLTCLTVYQAMRSRGLCDPNGASTLVTLHTACDIWANEGLAHVAWHDYDLGWASALIPKTNQYVWRADVVAQAKAGNPFVLMLHRGQSLADLISGQGENGSNIANHFIAGLGYHPGGVSDYRDAHGKTLPEGLWCADGASFAGNNNRGNNFNAANVLQFYSLDNLQKAWPCGFVVVAGRQKAGTPMAWTKQTDGSGKDDQGHTCGVGTYTALVAAGFAAFDGRMSEAHYPASGVADAAMLPLTNGATIHAVQQTAGGAWVEDENGSQVAVDLYEAWQAGLTQIAALNAKIAALEAAAPPVQPPAPQPPVSPPASSDPLATEALAVMTAQKAFFAKLP